MYHTFSAAVDSPDSDSRKDDGPNHSRRIMTSNACIKCRKRKIRCDGAQPCGQCQWYRHPGDCAYSKPAQRLVPSRKLLNKLSTSNEQYQAIIARLFPNQEVDYLASLPREELAKLAYSLPTAIPFASHATAANLTPESYKSEGGEDLEALEQAPDQDPELDEEERHKDRIQGISDDVNGLSLRVDKQASYVGISSVTAALKVIFLTAPAARRFIAYSHPDTAAPSRGNTPPPPLQSLDCDPNYNPSADIDHYLIECYFSRVHALMPMIDEERFWHTWLYGERRDGPWLALLNAVLALGSLASSNSHNERHVAYFRRARQHLELESLGSSNLLVLQAFALLSGYYLHYINRPNIANNLMGATLRMATVLGLHREYTESSSNNKKSDAIPASIRRRTWWSIFCLDTWASIATGRPSLGRISSGVTVLAPSIDAEKPASLKLLPLIHSIAFCRLATRIQDALAASPVLKFEELVSLDAELVLWHDTLPSVLQPFQAQQTEYSMHAHSELPRFSVPFSTSAIRTSLDPRSRSDDRRATDTCPEWIKIPRAIMHWRYQNLRIILHRPILLGTALRRTPFESLSTEEKVAVGRCRTVAAQTIADISGSCKEELMAGWNGVWFMYQAVMVPLVSLFAALSAKKIWDQAFAEIHPRRTHSSISSVGASANNVNHSAEDDVQKWCQQIETAISFFDRMRHWSIAARKSRDTVSRLYEASKQLREYNSAEQQRLRATNVTDSSEQYNAIPPNPAEAFPQMDVSEFGTFDSNGSWVSPGMLDTLLGQNIWGLSPSGDAAINGLSVWGFPQNVDESFNDFWWNETT